MKLTVADRNAFVNAAMGDVPKIEYQAQVQKLIADDAFKQLPKPIQDIVKKGDYVEYLEGRWFYMEGQRCLGTVKIYNIRGGYEPTVEVKEKVNELHGLHEAQSKNHKDLRDKLQATIYACTTLKMAKERLPEELHKYLPQERGASGLANLPMVANLMDEMTKAGWPKSENNAA